MATVRLAVRVEGIVQGVGFRPFVHALATRLGLGGTVANDGHGVVVEVEGDRERVERFLERLGREAPPLAVIEGLTSGAVPPQGDTAFRIAPSSVGPERATLVSPDIATCVDCLREVFDPADRRYRYPFTNCTNCGPRFTIVRDVPYDRATTAMASFPMCEACRREYEDPTDRRFHAEPIACPACGPRLVLIDGAGALIPGDPIEGATRLLRAGAVLAIKGLGGYHLAADAANEAAVAALRSRKHREEKPFALLAADAGAARALVDLTAEAETLLAGTRRPIVLARRRAGARVAEAVAPGNRFLGVMLPYTPLHHLLARALDVPIVLTSGNLSDEPIAHRDDEARARLGRIADAFLTHDRAIEIRTDDSVVRAVRGVPYPVRRARGYAPQPIGLPWTLARPVLACGAELKNTVCVARGRHAFLSHHIGDLESYDAFQAFTEAIAHLQRLFDVRPAIVAHDLHPEYLSTKWALDRDDGERVGVQHHHAHVAACLADNGEAGPVIGVAFDGLGYGPDGTLWGGEFLVADLARFERVGHLTAVPLPGGSTAIREPWRMAAVYLDLAFGTALPSLPLVRRHEAEWPQVLAVARSGFHAPPTSSAGRLFDAVAAIAGVRERITYEGQAAIELEQLVDPAESGAYPARLVPTASGFELAGVDLVRAAAEDVAAGVAAEAVAARFHNGMAALIVRGADAARERSGLATVALSGGVFQNVTLLEAVVDRLEARGFRVLWHRQVPPNDGGISLGQAVVADAVASAPPPGPPGS